MPWDELARAEFDAAYGELVGVTCHVVERFFRYDASGVGEVVAETMARVYERWEKVRNNPNPVAWTIACAKDVCLEQLRAQAETHADEPARPHHLSIPICDTLDHLNHAQRDVAVLRFMMGCDESTTAVALNLSVPRANALADKARTRMGALLTEVYPGSDEAVA